MRKEPSELYECEIRDSFGDVTSAALVRTPAEVAKWYMDHKIKPDSIEMKMKSKPNVIACYTAKES